MSQKFKPGDRVRALEETFAFDKGEIMEVFDCSGNSGVELFRCSKEKSIHDRHWLDKYFELAPVEDQPIPYKLISYPDEKAERKGKPLFRGVLRYFPDALLAVAEVSRVGNEQHNPGEPMHWAKEKSTDEEDALLRHLAESGTVDSDGLRHSAKVAWRALAMLQREIDKEKGR